MSGSKPCLPYSLTAEPKIEKGLMWGVVQGFKTLVKVSNLEIKSTEPYYDPIEVSFLLLTIMDKSFDRKMRR